MDGSSCKKADEIEVLMNRLFLALGLAISLSALAQDDVGESAGHLWEATKRFGATTWDATKDTSGEAWDARHHRWVEHRPGTATLASRAASWWECGAVGIGGCCRIGPEEIAELRRILLG